jgi:hypothetical protein
MQLKYITCALALLLMCGCSRKDNFACVEAIKNQVAIGASMERAKAVVEGCRMEYSIDPASKTLHGIVHGKSGVMTRESRTVTIKFDDVGRVASVEVGKEFTGP